MQHSDSRNVTLPFRCTGRCIQGVDLPVDMPIWALAVKNLKLPFTSTGRSTWGVDLPVDLPIWALTVKIWNCHSHPLADLWGGRSASWSANMSSNSKIWNCNSDPLADLPGGRSANFNTLYVSCFASQKSFHLYERPMKNLGYCTKWYTWYCDIIVCKSCQFAEVCWPDFSLEI